MAGSGEWTSIKGIEMALSGAVIFWVAALAAQAGGDSAPAEQVAPVSTPSVSTPGAPASNPATWVTSGDYPFSAMRERHEGTTGFRLIYVASGAPEKCEITSSSGHADLDDATCRLLMNRAWFRPGTDATGKPVGGTYSSRIRWTVPEGSGFPGEPGGPVPFSEPGRLTVDFTVDSAGAVVKCEGRIEGLVVGDRKPVEAGDPCHDIRGMAPYAPTERADGSPVARHYRMTVEVEIDDVEPPSTSAK